MKKNIVALILLIGLVGVAQAKNFTEGKEYKSVSVSKQTDDKIEVLEFLWYGCPHCYAFEPTVQKWLKSKPDNVEFIRVPAIFRPNWKVHARTYYALEQMGILEELHPKIFYRMHKDRKRLDKLEVMAGFLEGKKVDKEKFIAAYNSFAIETKVRKAIKLLKDYDVKGVPAVAVNGKYYITGESAGTYEKVIEVINYLVEKETAAKAK